VAVLHPSATVSNSLPSRMIITDAKGQSKNWELLLLWHVFPATK